MSAIWQDRYSSFLFVYFTEKNDGSVVFYFLLFGLDSGYRYAYSDYGARKFSHYFGNAGDASASTHEIIYDQDF